MAGRSFTVSFSLQGSMDGSLQAALKAAANAMRGLGNAAKSASAAAQASKSGFAGMAAGLNQLQAAAQKFRDLKKALAETSKGLQEAQANANKMAAQFRQEQKAADELKAKLAQLKTARAQAESNVKAQRDNLKFLRQQRAELKARSKGLKGESLQQVLSQLSANKAALTTARQNFQQTSAQLKELAKQARETERAFKDQSRIASQSGQGFEAAKAKAAALKESLRQQQEAISRLRTSLGSSGFSTASFAASERQLAAEIDRVNAALQRQQQLTQAQSRSAQASQEMFNAYNNFQGALSTAGQIAAPFKSAIDKSVEFERVMSEVKALTQMDNIANGKMDVVESEMSALTAQAKELGATTIYTAQQVGEAQAYIARTGWQTNQILGSTPIFLKLAASQHMDLARTADIATNVMTGFGHTLESVGGDEQKFAQMIQHDADVFAYTVTHSNQTFEQFGEAMKYAAPVAKNFGASIEEAAMMTKFMGDAGIQGSMAGTSMRQTMLRLVAPPKKATKAMEQYGVTLDDANAAWQNANAVAQEYGVTLDESLTPGRQFINVMRQIDKGMAGASDREKLSALSAITGINAVSGAMNIFGAGAEQAKNFTELLEKCDGALEQTYSTMTDNAYGAEKSFESAWEAIQLSVGDALLKAYRTAAEAVTPLMTATAQWIDQHPEVVQAAAAIAAALASIVVGAAAVKLAFAGWNFITSSITLVRAALATLADGALLGGLIGRLTALRTALFGLNGAATLGGWSAMFAAISTKATAAATAIRTFFTSLTLGSAASGIASTISSIGTAIAGATRAAMAFAFSPVGVALMALALAGLYVYQNWDKVSGVFSKIANIITGALGPAITQIQTAFNALSSSGGFSALSSAASQAASVIGGTLVKAFAVLLTIAASTVATIIQLLADLVTVIADIGTGIGDAFSKIKDGDFSGAFDALTSAGSKALGDLKKMGEHVFDGVEQGAKNVSTVIDALNAPQAQSSMTTAAANAAPIDTSQTQAALDQVGDAAQNAATNMDGVNQATEQISQAGTDVQALSTNSQQAGTQIQQLGTESQTAQSGVTNLGTAADGAQSGVGALGDAAGNSVGNILSMSDAAGAVAAALSTKATEIGSISISIPQISVGAAANAIGGIYNKGAFLTTFAEKSPEAAIPINNSARSRELWTKTGQMMGMLPGKGGTFDKSLKSEAAIAQYNKNPRDVNRLREAMNYLPDTQANRSARASLGGRRGNNPHRFPAKSQRFPSMSPVFIPTTPPTVPTGRGRQNRFDITLGNYGGGFGGFGYGIDGRFGDSYGGRGKWWNSSRHSPALSTGLDMGGGLLSGMTSGLTSPQRGGGTGGTTFNVTINVNAGGNADTNSIRQGVEQAVPSLEDWARKFAANEHERARRSFA